LDDPGVIVVVSEGIQPSAYIGENCHMRIISFAPLTRLDSVWDRNPSNSR